MFTLHLFIDLNNNLILSYEIHTLSESVVLPDPNEANDPRSKFSSSKSLNNNFINY